MTKFICNQTYYGFTLQEIEEISDIHSTAYLFFHEQSGARLLYLKNKDNNKVFNAAFKTPSSDDCGIPHILEHSVLCGSRKYEAKDPFNELAKGSLNTFLNAMTYADKTMYPVASCNEKDFHNLMDVYLDAVFYPKIYEKKEIFQQEGWRYLLQGDTLDVTGVVYNEMKGALSDPESQLSGVISRAIFGKTTYGFESGGDPKAIPDLTYDAFLDFHRKYYHPSNVYLYLYGNMEILPCLQHIHEEYLSAFARSTALPTITETALCNGNEILFDSYPAAEEGEGGTYFAYALKVGKCTDPERIMALQILSYVLLESNASPLKTALLQEGLCEETEGWFDSSTYEMVCSIIAKKADAEKIQRFTEVIETECHRLVSEGLPKELLKGALRKYDFLLREEDYGSTPKGLVYCSRLMKRWLHGENPCDSLRLLTIMEKLKAESKNGYFESLLEELFCKNKEKVVIVFTPDKEKAKKETESFSARMTERLQAMTEEDLTILKKDTEKLEQFQKQIDTPEILSQIPLLEISEIDPKPQLTKYSVQKMETGNPFLQIPLESNGILYLKLLFDTASIPQELLPYAGLLTDLLGKLDTEQYSYQELPNILNQTFGGFSLHNSIYQQNTEKYRSFVTVKMKLLQEDAEKAFAVLQEVLLHTKYDALESMKKIVKSAKIKEETMLLNQSHYFAIYYAGSNLSDGLHIEDLTSGIRYYHFLCEIDAQLEKDAAPVITKLRQTAEILFTKQNMEVALGAEEKEFSAVQELLDTLALPNREKMPQTYHFHLAKQRIGLTSIGGVVYNTVFGKYLNSDTHYHGKYKVLQTILNLEYLWNQVRVQGGAYGAGSKFLRNGYGYFYSYRDPNVQKTYDIYKALAENISHFQADEREMTKYILGTINEYDQPKTSMDIVNAAISRFYQNITDEFLETERLEILKTTADDIRSCADILERISCENICTIGNEQKIKDAVDLFEQINPLL